MNGVNAPMVGDPAARRAVAAQQGYVLVAVLLVVAVLSLTAYMATREAGGLGAAQQRSLDMARADYAAEAGMAHAVAAANDSNCTGYTLPATAFNGGSYRASYTPTSGSPVDIKVSATSADGAVAGVTRSGVPVYRGQTAESWLLHSGNTADATLDQASPAATLGGGATVAVNGNTLAGRRALVAAQLGSLPADVRIDTATLRLSLQGAPATPATVDVQLVTSPWDEAAVSWADASAGVPWGTPGGDLAGTVASASLGSGDVGAVDIDVRDALRAWVNDGAANHGVALTGGSTVADHVFRSVDTDPGAACLSVVYGCPCGATCAADPGIAPPFGCTAAFEPVTTTTANWPGAASDLFDISFLPSCSLFGDVAVPPGGALLVMDQSNKRLYLTDFQANVLHTLNTPGGDSWSGVEYISSGLYAGHVVITKKGKTALRVLDDQGNTVASTNTGAYSKEPRGIGYIDRSASGTWDEHLLVVSDKDAGGGLVGGFYIVDQTGALRQSVNINSFANEPWGISHLPGTDNVLVAEKNGTVNLVTLDGVLLGSWSSGAGEPQGITIDTERGRQVVNDEASKRFRLQERGTGACLPPNDPVVVLMVGDEDNLDAFDQARVAWLEAEGYAALPVSDDRSSTELAKLSRFAEAVWVSRTANANVVTGKLNGLERGIVNEENSLSDDWGVASGNSDSSAVATTITDNSHYITQPFALGSLTLLDSSDRLVWYSGTRAPDRTVLSTTAGNEGLQVLRRGSLLYTLERATARRVMLPWGAGTGFDFTALTADAHTLLRRALQWVAVDDLSGPDFVDNFSSSSFANNDGSLSWSAPWVEEDTFLGGGPLLGFVTISGGRLRLQSSTVSTTDPFLYRRMDLSTFATALLVVDWSTTSGVDAADSLVLGVRNGGSGGFFPLDEWTGVSGSRSGVSYYDLTNWAAVDTEIGFFIGAGSYQGPSESFRVKDVRVVTGP